MSKSRGKNPAAPLYTVKQKTVLCVDVQSATTITIQWEERRGIFRKQTRTDMFGFLGLSEAGSMGRGRQGREEDPTHGRDAVSPAFAAMLKFRGKRLIIEYAAYPQGDILRDEAGVIIGIAYTTIPVLTSVLGLPGKNINLWQLQHGLAALVNPQQWVWSTPGRITAFQNASSFAATHRRGIHKGAKQQQQASKLLRYSLYAGVFGFIVGALARIFW